MGHRRRALRALTALLLKDVCEMFVDLSVLAAVDFPQPLRGNLPLVFSFTFFSHEAAARCCFDALVQTCCAEQMLVNYVTLYFWSIVSFVNMVEWSTAYCSTACVQGVFPEFHRDVMSLNDYYYHYYWPSLTDPCLLFCSAVVTEPGRSVMSTRFRLPAGRSYNVRATELERDRPHTQVVCNVLLLDNTIQAFKVNVSTAALFA